MCVCVYIYVLSETLNLYFGVNYLISETLISLSIEMGLIIDTCAYLMGFLQNMLNTQ